MKNNAVWTAKHADTIISRLQNNTFRWLSSVEVSAVTAPMLLEVLCRIEERGALETAHRVKQICGQVFRYAIAYPFTFIFRGNKKKRGDDDLQ